MKSEEEKDQSLTHKQFTEKLYYLILGWHIRGRLKGKLVDIDLELENRKLKDEVMRFKLQNDELRKENIILATELKDKSTMLDKYENATDTGKKY